MSDVIPEEELTIEKVLEVLRAAFFKCEVDSDGDIQVVTDHDLVVIISVDADIHVVKYATVLTLREDGTREQQQELIHLLNTEVILGRFALLAENTMSVDYFLLGDGGLTPFQLVNTLRWFSRVVVTSIRGFDEQQLVE